ncbi:MAG TPA: bifunctional riboflavin kinase/FAD synthetase [Dehalococcoidia bacterium]|nr:bifunctional riboflavin kinase/FAD synthetase [Dehalococcoidia bacterium]
MSDGTAFAREELRRAAAPGRSAAVAIGVFDGVHRGHRHLIGHLVDRAGREGLARLVVTFHPHPRSVLRPETPVTYLCGLEERVELLQALGVDDVAVLAFTSELAQLSASDFVSLVVEELRMKLLVIGADFALGRGREGTTDVLAAIGGEVGFEVDVVPLLAASGEKVGSTAVRQALERGDMETVASLLGRSFALRGPVIKGAERGKGLGFPTANMAFGLDRALPAFGVYVTRAYLREGVFPAVTNVGLRPTFHEDKPTVETFILDFQGEVYGQELRIELLHRLRGEIRFPSPEALREQIEKDVAATRAYLS